MKYVYEQFVEDVTDFSSQYGSTGSISYVAHNMCGESTLYPSYGDFSGSYSMQSYGKWWKYSPSAAPSVPDPHPLFNSSIYNPGSVVRIWGCLKGSEWILLWSGAPSLQLAQARIFSPPITQHKKFINMLRIEFDQSIHEYHCEFEAVLLVGSTDACTVESLSPKIISNSLLEYGINIKEMSFSEEEILSGIKFLLSDELQNLESYCISEYDSNSTADEETEQKALVEEDKHSIKPVVKHSTKKVELQGGYFSMLPGELVIHIMKLVDIRCRCRLARTCRILNSYAACSLFYQHLNFKNSWWLVNDSTFHWLTPVKCIQLKSLDLSWCGSYDRISSQSFMEFINQSGHNLIILHLNNCHFIDNYCLYIIANTCFKLEVCLLAKDWITLGFGELKKLRKLKYLDISRTAIRFETLHIILQNLDHLNHLIIHHCNTLDIDKVAQTLKTFNQSLISLGAWKTHGLTFRGLRSLSSLESLEELDVGWAVDRFSGSLTEGLSELIKKCKKMKKLFMTAFRALSDEDVDLLATYGNSLEQVDLMGSRHISPPAVSRVQILIILYSYES
ncbi:F-box/LRR-repeat protein 4 [Armadillidium vulgare]|nr:F-box/LRR-repeat protein 4 [Armadillidium vulgare]